MRGAFYLAGRYLASHPTKTAILVVSIALMLYIPGGLWMLVGMGENELRSRAEATPLLTGRKGSPVELVLNSLYFASDVPERMRYGHVEWIEETEFAEPIPLYVRFRAGKDPIVGTSLAYFRFRGLSIARGRKMARIGDCVLGARVAERRGIGPGGSVISSPENVFDLAGVYPLKMRVTGVLAPLGTPDDDAIFVDLKTTWIIEGLAHGHQDLTDPKAAKGVLERKEGVVVANASVVQYNEITEANMDSFHFHGDPAGFPLTAVIAVPHDTKSATLLMGRYLDPDERHQILKPRAVMDELLGTVVTVRGFVVAGFGFVGLALLATAALVFTLSLRLRRREFETMVKIGGSRSSVGILIASEICGVFLAAFLAALLLLGMTAWFGSDAVRALIQ